MRKVAMFGGSFNPVHIGHSGLVSRMIDEFQLDKVYVVPTYSTPLKDNTPMVTAKHRYNMCKLAFAEFEKIEVSDIEIKRQGRSYTVDTLKELLSNNPDSDFFLIVGADSFMQLPLWYQAERIFSMATVLTVSRGEINASELLKQKSEYETKYGAKVFIAYDPIAPISSTNVREAIEQGREYKYLLNPKVSDYIKSKGLYVYGCT